MTRICLAVLLALITAIAPRATAPVPALGSAALDAAIAREMSRRSGVGASVAVVQNGDVVLAKTYGRRSLEPPQPADDSTLFGIGSVTKQFTSASILLLVEAGKLSVDDKVAKWYPALTRASDISVLDLMNHVSGYPDYYPLDFVDRRMQQPIAADDLLNRYAGGRLDFEPGTRWSYSNTGFILLGRIVERASGMSLGAFLQQRIFGPIGMTHTVFDLDPHDPRLAVGYTSFALTRLEPASREGAGWVGGAGAIYSTAADLARWDTALMDGRVLKAGSLQLMLKPRMLANGRSSHYGCGVGVADRNGTTIYTHGGAVSGFIARNIFIPSSHSAVAVLVNEENGPLANAIVDAALASVLPQQKDVPVTRGPSAAGTDRGEIPHVAGAEASAAARKLFEDLQAGRVDRSALGEEYSAFLTDAKARAAAQRLKSFGRPTGATVRSLGERGGMEVSTVRLAFASGTLDALMYRSPDGKVQEFLVSNP